MGKEILGWVLMYLVEQRGPGLSDKERNVLVGQEYPTDQSKNTRKPQRGSSRAAAVE